MAAFIINIVVGCMVGMIFLILGIRQCKSKLPVAMNTGEKPPKPEQLSDVRAWNAGHGRALIKFGIAIAFTVGIFPVVLDHIHAGIAAVVFIVIVAAEIAGLEINHCRLERRYRLK